MKVQDRGVWDVPRARARGTSLIACSAVKLGVVKPHGRLGPLRSERVAPRPRAAYRRSGLLRPFRELEAPGGFILGRASHLDAFSGYHSRPSLPGVAAGAAAGTRAGRPTRSNCPPAAVPARVVSRSVSTPHGAGWYFTVASP